MNIGTLLRIGGIGIGSLLAVYLAYDMHHLYNSDQLWGHRVLWFWVALWTALLCTIGQLRKGNATANKRLLASTISGLLLAGGFMPMPTFFLMFIAFVPLLWIEQQLVKEQVNRIGWKLFGHAFNTFFIWNIISTWWIQNSSFAAGIFGNALNAVFMTIPILFYHITRQQMTQRAANFGFISYWLTFEIGHLTWDLSWPWLTLGNSFAHLPILVQWYEYTGVFGGSLWILLINIWIANEIISKDIPLQKWRTGAMLKALLLKPILSLIIPIALSVVLYTLHKVETDKTAEVVSLQPNYEPHYQKFTTSEHVQFANFMKLSKEAVTASTDYLVFPETSFRGIRADRLEEARVVTSLQQFVKGYPQLNLVVGLSTHINYDEGDLYPPNVYSVCNENRSYCRYIDSHNAAIQLNNETEKIPYYKKSKLVPGAESMPLIGGIDFFKNMILDLGGAPGLSLGTQKERAVFNSKAGNAAPLICYESIYGDYVTGYTKKGANLFFVITNDGWWDNTWGHRQHMYLSSLRAIENRRYVVRSANTGVSCFIDSKGTIYNETKYDEAIALKDEVYLHEERTFYSLYGDLIGRVSVLVTLWILVSMISNGLRQRNPEE